MDVVANKAGEIASHLERALLLLHDPGGFDPGTLVRISEVLTLVLAKGDSADVVPSILEPCRDDLVWDLVFHLLVDGVDQRAAADVAAREDWCEISH